MNDKRMIFILGIVFLFLASVSFTYAYFSSSIVNSNTKDHIVRTGSLELTLVDGEEIYMQNVYPGASINKTIYVKNTGSLDTSYNVIWQKYKNEIINNEISIEASCTRMDYTSTTDLGSCDNLLLTPLTGNNVINNAEIPAYEVHRYDINIIFNDTSQDQNYNQGKMFYGVLGIEESNGYNFETDTWDTIIYNIRSGNERYYKVGNTKNIDLGVYGTHKIRIANNSTPDECNYGDFSQTTCGFVLEFADIITTYDMNETNTNVGGYPSSSLYTFLNNNIYNSFPDEVKNIMMQTQVVSSHGNSDTNNFITNDYLYLLSSKEVFNTDTGSAYSKTRQLDYYSKNIKDINNRDYAIKTDINNNYEDWWLRDAMEGNMMGYDYITESGNESTSLAIGSKGISPAFRIS